MKKEDRDLLIRLDENVKTIKKTLESTDKKFAAKWIEKPVIGLCSVIILAVVTALVNTVVHAISK